MEIFIDAQVQFILFVQSLGAWLNIPMQVLTFLGNPVFYLLVTPVLYWCVDSKIGLRFGLALILTGAFNIYLKWLFHAPRPFWVSRQVNPIHIEMGFGMPSGHAQNSVVVFATLARFLSKPWAWVTAAVMAVLIGFSRLYLGVHFLGDVIVGWLVGVLIFFVLLKAEKPVLSWMQNRTEPLQYLIIFMLSVAVIVSGWIVQASLHWTIPPIWEANISRYLAPGEAFDPIKLSEIVSLGGITLGLAGGGLWMQKSGGFNARGKPAQLVARYVLGVIGVMVFYLGLGAVFPDGENFVAFVFRYVRYGLIGLWISAQAPLLFQRLHLVE